MKLSAIIQGTGARGETAADPEISRVTGDSRDVVPGAVFFALPGAARDGHDFVPDAVWRGAAAVVAERSVSCAPAALLLAPSSRRAMAIAAANLHGRPADGLALAGVTGTNGKTTTTYLIHSIFDAAGMRPGLIGTIESRVGGEARPAVRTTPEAIDLQRTFRSMLDAGDRSAAMEATSHGSELGRLERVRFDALAFTNLTQDHLDFHGSMDQYYKAKRRLFVEHEPAPAAAINVGDEWGRRLAADLQVLDRAPLLTYGLVGNAELRWEDVDVETRLYGRFNRENMLAAVAVSRLLGVPAAAIDGGLSRLPGVPGRFESVDEGQPFTVLVDYAHTPDSLANVLRTARELTGGQLICVFGCGGDRDRGKRPEMGRIASELADVAIVTSDNPRSEDPLAIIEEILAGAAEDVRVEPDRRAAIALAVEQAGQRDVVVIAGKGHEQGQEFADRKVPFDDREVAREALRRLGAPA
jgi:UDP-N-acetylmuramoyl-L-alanyl-D-glutamate--2,6-diaminopimelate ligase